MLLQDRINALIELGRLLREPDEYLEAVMHRSHYHNQWFTMENQRLAVGAIAAHLLDPVKLRTWAGQYDIPEDQLPKTVGLVMAGNIPLVGWHDVQCVFISGCKARIKLSEKDQYLLPYLLKLLERIDARTAAYFEIVPQLRGFDAVIATGSNNTSRYFETYFAAWPHIIRRNRNAVAVLDGTETHEELLALGDDIFRFFGLGCRNVAKIYVPEGYDFQPLLETLHEFRQIVLHDKYKHNYDYNFALFALNKTPFLMAGSILLTENTAFQSRIATLHYARYSDIRQLEAELAAHQEAIQCIVCRDGLLGLPTVPFGKAQEPELWDYADGVDTMRFLCG